MSEANTADLSAPVSPAGDATSLTASGAAPVSPDQGGQQQQQSSGAGEGVAAAAVGQGAGSENAGNAGASADGQPPAGNEGGAAQGAPDAYAAFTLPEGYALEGDALDGVTALAKAHNFTQDQAQALVDLGVKQSKAIFDGIAREAAQNPVLMAGHWTQEWSKQTSADPEIGGQKLQQTMALSQKVFSTFGTPELGKFLTDTGLAHHPELIRFMHKVGQAVSEDTLVTAQGGTAKVQTGRDPAKKLYPGMN